MKQKAQRQTKQKRAGNGSKGHRISVSDLPFWSPGESSAHSYEPASSTHPLLGSSPTIPALLLLVVLALLLSSPWLGNALGSARNFPGLAEVVALFRKNHSSLPRETVRVWAKKQFGFYYCQGDILFGRKPGELMAQTDALMSGYRPAGRHYCTNNKPAEVSAQSVSSQWSSTK